MQSQPSLAATLRRVRVPAVGVALIGAGAGASFLGAIPIATALTTAGTHLVAQGVAQSATSGALACWLHDRHPISPQTRHLAGLAGSVVLMAGGLCVASLGAPQIGAPLIVMSTELGVHSAREYLKQRHPHPGEPRNSLCVLAFD